MSEEKEKFIQSVVERVKNEYSEGRGEHGQWLRM